MYLSTYNGEQLFVELKKKGGKSLKVSDIGLIPTNNLQNAVRTENYNKKVFVW